ncbi:MAG: L-threonylcarbamoyladenylate synthase [Hydrogenophilaceae bacterium]|nr:L-threonylcarbamoyladenylate synthase [Hydrogenophilaceae bacterium]
MKAGALRAFLKQGGIIAYPTESCYGLGCDPMNRRAVRKIIRLKGRSAARGLILIAASRCQLRPYATRAAIEGAWKRGYWPGPVTWVLPTTKKCPDWLTAGKHTIAVRITAHPGAARICRKAGMALVSTSANKSGEAPAKTAEQCKRIFGGQVKVLPGKIGVRKRPSTLIDFASGNILRP